MDKKRSHCNNALQMLINFELANEQLSTGCPIAMRMTLTSFF